MKDLLRLCLSLYACEPHRGSEPGVGWAWALGMAKRHETWAITRANNRDAIETELDRRGVPEEDRPHFVWVDLPRWVCRLKKRGLVPTALYYLLWQFAARRAWDRTGVRVDIIQHVTFNSFVLPGVWWRRKEKVVLGPLGGTSICPAGFLRAFSPLSRVKETFRSAVVGAWRFNPFFVVARRFASAIVFVDPQNASKMGGKCDNVSTLLELAVPGALEEEQTSCTMKRQFVWAGRLEGRKGCDIAVRAFASAFGGVPGAPKLLVVGQGPDLRRLRRLARKTGIGDLVEFRGKVPQDELWAEFRRSYGLLFTSVRDTSGNVALEAMANKTPVVCLRHQGVAEIVDNDCCIAVEPSSYRQVVDDFAAAMQCLVDDPGLVDRLGASGRKRALDKFTWERKFDTMDEIYRKVLDLP